MNPNRRRHRSWMAAVVSFLATTVAVVVVGGCGGGGSSAGVSRKAALELTVAWPERPASRLVPLAAESIRVTVEGENGFTKTQVIVRPEASTRITDLPPGILTVRATAHPNSDPGDSTPQASATQTVTAVADQTFSLSLTLESTIDHVAVSTEQSSVRRGAGGILAVSAFDNADRLVLTHPSTWTWSSSAPATVSVQTVDGTPRFDALAKGTATVTATETESGHSASIDFSVASPPPTLVLTGPAGTRLVGETATLSWDSTDAVAVTAGNFGATTVSGSKTVSPNATTTYTLTVANDLGETAEKSVAVTVATVVVAVSPSSPVLDIRKQQSFAAEVSGAVDTSVTWSVLEAGGGTITAAGVYTAPAVAGTYHVRATSKADPTKSATATVRVRAAGGSIVID